MKKKILAVALTGLIIIFAPTIIDAANNLQAQLNTITEVYNLINDEHISNVDIDTLAEGAIEGMIEATGDPYTTYFTAEEYNTFIADVDGSFTGIGIYIGETEEYVVVQSPIKGSPAEEAGIEAGDLIINVEGIDMFGKSTEEVASLVRGEEGTTVNITLLREDEEFNVDVMRASIQIPNAESEMLSDSIGYLAINTFGSTSDTEVYQQLEQLKSSGMEQLVLDLRGNGGGYLNAALQISTNFIKNGPVLYVLDSDGNEEGYEINQGNNWDLPMVVLINGGSASASEILVGVLDDYDKATIIGENTFGKGTVQTIIPLENGGYLKLTINEYFTPNKNKINGIGIAPDIEVLNQDKQLEAAILYLSNENGYDLDDQNWFSEGGKDYISIKSTIKSIGGNVCWNSKNKTIEIILEQEKVQLSKNLEGLLIENGIAYIDKEVMNELFPGILITKINETITIYHP